MDSVTARARVLVVSHDLAWSAHQCARLTLAGMEAVAATDNIEVLSMVRAQSVELAILDLPLADVAAMDLPRVLRQISDAAYLPVIVIGNSDHGQLSEFLQHGADEIVPRETNWPDMLARVGHLLRVKELHEQLFVSRACLQAALDRERKLLQKLQADNLHLQVLATTDPLTHLHNRRSFTEILTHEFESAKRYGHSLGLLTMDLDHFKLINDTYGHPAGDYVLKELAVTVKNAVRQADVVARTGGEEFCVLLTRANAQRTEQFARRIRQAVARTKFSAYGNTMQITVSVGTANYPGDALANEADMLMYFADQALLWAKESGRNRVVSFSDMDPAARARLWKLYNDTAPSRTAPPQARSEPQQLDGGSPLDRWQPPGDRHVRGPGGAQSVKKLARHLVKPAIGAPDADDLRPVDPDVSDSAEA
jgi:diguanylate cyclase (GGDEF)-like protein